MTVLQSVMNEEGYRQFPYICTAGKLTVGYGFNLDDVGLSEEESIMILQHRLYNIRVKCEETLSWFKEIKSEAQDIIIEMVYQLGYNGVLKFKMMIKALEEQDYAQAAIEGLDSRWAKQTPARAERLMTRMKGIK